MGHPARCAEHREPPHDVAPPAQATTLSRVMVRSVVVGICWIVACSQPAVRERVTERGSSEGPAAQAPADATPMMLADAVPEPTVYRHEPGAEPVKRMVTRVDSSRAHPVAWLPSSMSRREHWRAAEIVGSRLVPGGAIGYRRLFLVDDFREAKAPRRRGDPLHSAAPAASKSFSALVYVVAP